MSQIDLHNVVIFLMLLVCGVPLAMTSQFGWQPGIVYGALSFVILCGRVLTHGMDLSRHGSGWRPYVAVNLLFNGTAWGVLFGLFWVLG